MREIKFRGKHRNPYGDKWVYGYYALFDGEHVVVMPHSTSYEKALKDNTIMNTVSARHTVDINTLGQYTGIKDKNGTEIYEGDIIKAKFFEKHITGKIEFAWGAFFVTGSAVSDNQMFIFDDFEVIGNIYDNPDLLEQEE